MRSTSHDGRTQRAQAKREARRAEILNAAEGLFSQRGFHATSVTDVIETAGISRGTFYLYFDSKEALFLDLMEVFILRITRVVKVVDPTGPDPWGQIFKNVRRVVDVVFDNREMTIVVLRENYGLNPEIDRRLQKLYGFLHEMVEGALKNGADIGLTRRVDEKVVGSAIIGAVRQVFVQFLLQSEEPRDREVITKSLYEFAVRGLLLAE